MKIIQTVRVTVDSKSHDEGFEVDQELLEEEKRTDFKKTKQELVDVLIGEGADKVELLDFEVEYDE